MATVAKILLVTFNVLVWIGGGMLLGFGVWMIVDPTMVNNLNVIQITKDDPLVFYAAIIFVVIGAVAFLVGFVGFCGAHTESQTLLCTYATLLLLIMTIEIVAAVLVIVYQAKVDKVLKTQLADQLKHEYGLEGNSMTTEVWDKLQSGMRCCGASDYSDYESSSWFNNQKEGLFVPKSCCVTDESSKIKDEGKCQTKTSSSNHAISNNFVYSQGCYDAIQKWFHAQTIIMIILAFAVAALEVLGLIAACWLRASVGRSTETEEEKGN